MSITVKDKDLQEHLWVQLHLVVLPCPKKDEKVCN